MKNTALFAGFNSVTFSQSLSDVLGIPMGKTQTDQFADGEIRVRILDDVAGKDVIILQSLYPKTNTAIIQLCFLADIAIRLRARKVISIVPYMGYSRQDKAHRGGEAVSAEVVAKMLEISGITRFVTFDIHSLHVLDYFGIVSENISALPTVVNHVVQNYLQGNKKNLVLISPDQDGAKRVKGIAEMMKINHGFVQKERDLESVDTLKETHGHTVIGDIAGKNVILLDDMIATGATLVAASEKLKKNGAKRIFAGSTHGIFAYDPKHVFDKAPIEKVVVTDTIMQKNTFDKLSVVSAVSLLAAKLKEILN